MRKYNVPRSCLNLVRRRSQVRPGGMRRDEACALTLHDSCERVMISRVHRELAAVVIHCVAQHDASKKREGRNAVGIHAVDVPSIV